MNLKAFLLLGIAVLILSERDVFAGTQNFKVDGMHCEACEKSIQKEVKKIPGVTDVNVDHKTGSLTVKSKDETPVKASEIIEAVKRSGFAAKAN